MSDDRRAGQDRRQAGDGSYSGPERRQGDRRSDILPPPWLDDLRDLIRRYEEAGEAFDILKIDSIHTPGGDEPAEELSEDISDEMEQLNRDAGALLGAVPDDELRAALAATDGSAAEAEAMRTELSRRGAHP
jgi:hypothetical protein